MPGQSAPLAQAYAARREQAASSVATNRSLADGVVFGLKKWKKGTRWRD